MREPQETYRNVPIYNALQLMGKFHAMPYRDRLDDAGNSVRTNYWLQADSIVDLKAEIDRLLDAS